MAVGAALPAVALARIVLADWEAILASGSLPIDGTPPLLVINAPLLAVARPTTVVPAAEYHAS